MNKEINLPSIHGLFYLGQSSDSSAAIPVPHVSWFFLRVYCPKSQDGVQRMGISGVFSLYPQLHFLKSNFNITYTALYIVLLLTVPDWEVTRPTEDKSAAVDELVIDTIEEELATQV